MQVTASNYDGSVIARVNVPQSLPCKTLRQDDDGAKILQIIDNLLICGDYLVVFPAKAGLAPSGKHKEQFCSTLDAAKSLYEFVGGK